MKVELCDVLSFDKEYYDHMLKDWKPTLFEQFILGGYVIAVITLGSLLYFYDDIFFFDLVTEEQSIAKVVKVRARPVRRRPVSFSFNPLKKGFYLGNGDRIFTGPKASLTIRFKNETTINIGPKSLLDIRLIDGTIDLFISSGEISGEISKDSKIEINSKTESMTISADEATTFEVKKLSGTSMALTEYKLGVSAKKRGKKDAKPTEEPAVFKRKDKDKTRALKVSSKEDNSEPSREAGNQQALSKDVAIVSPLEIKESEFNYKLPYPADNTLVLFNKPSLLPIVMKKRCLDECTASLKTSGGLNYKREIRPGDIPAIGLKITERLNTKVEWKLQEKGKEPVSGLFFVKKFTDEALREGILREQNIEVLE